ncbi:MAG: hypothetical protein HQL46_02615 [Gammaproteobacteria bacterium]|nr:hypothetical protein [Gammaproteobacteria bacterium]
MSLDSNEEALRQYCLSQLGIPVWLDRQSPDFDNKIQSTYVIQDRTNAIVVEKTPETQSIAKVITFAPEKTKPNVSPHQVANKKVTNSQVHQTTQANISNKITPVEKEAVQEVENQQNKTDNKQNYQHVVEIKKTDFFDTQLTTLNQEINNCQQCQQRNYQQKRLLGRFLCQNESVPTLALLVESPRDLEQQNNQLLTSNHLALLNNILTGMELNIFNVYVTDVLKCHTKRNQPPSNEEYEACFSYLIKELSLLDAKHIVVMGNFNFEHFFKFIHIDNQNEEKINSLKQLRTENSYLSIMTDGIEKKIPINFTFHPDFLLRHPLYKAQAQDDWLKIKNALDCV